MENTPQEQPVPQESSPTEKLHGSSENNKSQWSKILLIVIGILAFIGVGIGGYYLGTKKNISSPTTKQTITTPSKIANPNQTNVNTSRNAEIVVSQTVISAPTIVTQGHILNHQNGETTLISPDGNQTATFILNHAVGEGEPWFTDISVFNNVTKKSVTYHITGPLLQANNIFWSPVDNKLYFTHSTNGVGIYALWSSNIDGTNALLISGNTDNVPYKSDAVLENSPMYGATDVKFSKDGKTIVTTRQKDYINGNFNPSYWEMNYDGSNAHTITQAEYNNLVVNMM